MGARRSKGEATFWISYADLSTGLLLVFILLVAYFINLKASSEQALREDQRRVDAIQREIEGLLGRRDELATRLEVASRRTNETLGRDVFAYDPATQQVVVQTDDQEVAWFRQGSARLAPQAKVDVTTFYLALYEQILCATDPGSTASDACERHPPRVPEFLDAIEILGHSDPVGRGPGQARWSWEAFNGTASSGYGLDSNLELAQARAKSIVDAIQELYGVRDGDRDRDHTHPWRPFLALVKTSGRSWMAAYCEASDGERPLRPEDFLASPPCPTPASNEAAQRLEARSRRVSFGFRLDDKEILERLQRLTEQVEALGRTSP